MQFQRKALKYSLNEPSGSIQLGAKDKRNPKISLKTKISLFFQGLTHIFKFGPGQESFCPFGALQQVCNSFENCSSKGCLIPLDTLIFCLGKPNRRSPLKPEISACLHQPSSLQQRLSPPSTQQLASFLALLVWGCHSSGLNVKEVLSLLFSELCFSLSKGALCFSTME